MPARASDGTCAVVQALGLPSTRPQVPPIQCQPAARRPTAPSPPFRFLARLELRASDMRRTCVPARLRSLLLPLPVSNSQCFLTALFRSPREARVHTRRAPCVAAALTRPRER
ncbi:hypothetical protein GY45DRAFT_1329526 [Cubamyces sp. BRFM 1775]|nr:hypothetical protein GY45DRAFT_1329526 [Cubamyces sp. BRFM 1775]